MPEGTFLVLPPPQARRVSHAEAQTGLMPGAFEVVKKAAGHFQRNGLPLGSVAKELKGREGFPVNSLSLEDGRHLPG